MYFVLLIVQVRVGNGAKTKMTAPTLLKVEIGEGVVESRVAELDLLRITLFALSNTMAQSLAESSFNLSEKIVPKYIRY